MNSVAKGQQCTCGCNDDPFVCIGHADTDRADDRQQEATFQSRVQPWLTACFGETIATDVMERNHRFLEEALELVQACGCTASEAHQLVDYVFARPVGQPTQEVGGVMLTLAALCLANALNMHDEGEIELARVWTKAEAIRAKQAAKPKHSPLAQASADPADRFRRLVDRIANWSDAEVAAAHPPQVRYVAQRVIAGADPLYPPFAQ